VAVVHRPQYGVIGACWCRFGMSAPLIGRVNLPSAPPKATDRRSFDGDETWQCEALNPRTLAAILQAAIDERFDRDLYGQVLEEERETRQGVLTRLRNPD
jgi:hypothetical protein